MICIMEVHNKETLQSETIAYLPEINNERYEQIKETFIKIITPTEREKFTLRWYYYPTDWDNEQIVWEALNAIRER